MESLPELKKIPHLNFRKDRGTYFTRLPVPEDLKEFYMTSTGKYQKHVTRSISASTAKAIRHAHDSNLEEIRFEFREKRKSENQRLLEIERLVKVSNIEKSPTDRRIRRARNRKGQNARFEEKLGKFATSCKITDNEMSTLILEWYEVAWSKANQRLQLILKLKMDVTGSVDAKCGGELVEQLGNIEFEKSELILGVDPSFPNSSASDDIHHVGYISPDEVELKRLFIEKEFRLKDGCPAFLKMKRLIKGIMEDLLQWQVSSYEVGKIKSFSSRTLQEVRQLAKSGGDQSNASPINTTSNISSVTVRQLFEAFTKHKEKNKDVGKSVWNEVSLMKELSISLFGKRSISSITKAEIMNLKDMVSNMASRKDRRFRNMPLLDAIKIGIEEDLPRLNNSTVNRYRQVLMDAFIFGAKSGWIQEETIAELRERFNDSNRSRNISIKTERMAFTGEELSLIFNSPTFTGMRGESSGRYRSGDIIYWDHRYWGTLIALFTGMRPKEIWQLRSSQIKEEDGIKYFDIKTEYDDQSIKTKESGFRKAPIHSKLLELGFLDYINGRDSDDYVLHSIKKSKDSDLTGYLTSWFNATLLKKLGIVGKPGQKVFYSFRHTFATTAIRSSVNEGILDELCGWSSEERRMLRKNMRANYTKAGHGMLLLKDSVEKIQYPSIDFLKMNPDNFQRISKYQLKKV